MLTNILLDRPLAVLDLETTGIDTANDRIVEISILRVMPDGTHDHGGTESVPDIMTTAAQSTLNRELRQKTVL